MIYQLPTSGERVYAEAFIKARLQAEGVSGGLISKVWAAGILAAIEDKEVKR